MGIIVTTLLSTFAFSALAQTASTVPVPDKEAMKVAEKTVIKEDSMTKRDEAMKKRLEEKSVNLMCVKTAVEKRETTIIEAFDVFSISIKSALGMRKTDLSAGWSIADRTQRKSAIDTAWKKFKESHHINRKTLNASRVGAWKQFSTDRKACKGEPTGENSNLDIVL